MGQGVRRNYMWFLVIVVIFIGLGEAKRWEGRGRLKSYRGAKPQKKGEGIFY